MEDRVDGVTNKVAQLLKNERGCEIIEKVSKKPNHSSYTTIYGKISFCGNSRKKSGDKSSNMHIINSLGKKWKIGVLTLIIDIYDIV
ncbi:hypothetical protein [Lactococcus kimchii]|uniref:hypothetical protein n=1 Tax=Lactococcus sp. S-13 TaxID=2507158 RepID=UPI001022C402|nr:hypothetical protein [Lactococcus sp. S-13]RZI49020.1 hypothetical protein EQJ87_05940 [Lactococcus sp. S-13]